MAAVSVTVMSLIVEEQPWPVDDAAVPDLGELGEILDDWAAALDRLIDFDPTVLSDAGVEQAIQRVVQLGRRVPAGRNGLVGEAIVRVLPRVRRFASTGTYLRDLVRCSAGEGNAWARQAEALVPRQPISGGEALPPVLPETAAAVRDGAVGDAHVRHILATMRLLPADLPPVERADWEALLARQARVLDPDALDTACKHVLAGVDPDGSLGSRDSERARKRDLTIGRQGVDGMTPVRGLLTPEAAALVRSALDPLASPRPTVDAPDTRLAGQRNHDALAELARRALAGGDLPVRHGHHATLLVTIGLADLEARTGIATVAHGGHLSVEDLLHRAAEASVIPVVLDADGIVMHYGQEQRLADEHQRRALIVTDIGCTWPGCAIPAVWCEAAHCEPFRISKQTSINDLALMCGYHHDYADTHHWQINRHNGRVWFTPPAWVDPHQTPRTNEYFKPLRT